MVAPVKRQGERYIFPKCNAGACCGSGELLGDLWLSEVIFEEHELRIPRLRSG